MVETIMKFTDSNVDGCGTDVSVLARVYGKDVTLGTIDKIKDAVNKYQEENEDWDSDECFDIVQEVLEAEGFEVHWINPDIEVNF